MPLKASSGNASFLTASLSPAGRVVLRESAESASPPVPASVAARIVEAFERGSAHGALHLGVAEPRTDFDPTVAFWRELGRSFVQKACAVLDPLDTAAPVSPDFDPEELESAVLAVPPMPGAENVSAELLERLWREMGAAFAERAKETKGGASGYLRSGDSIWHVVGRVCLHLAENKRSPDHPFAFLATYVRQVSSQAKPQHVPLGRALQQYAGAKDRQRLLALLAPLRLAAEESPLMRQLVDSGDVYHPLAWSSAEAHRFLCELPLLEESGLVVRAPPWWQANNRPRPRVTASVGDAFPAGLGLDALLDFNIHVVLDGARLTKKEITQLLSGDDGLVLLKGRWVEVDRDQLRSVLEQWRELESRAREGVSFSEAMRLLAGADLGAGGAPANDDRPEWSQVVAGKWLAERLGALRAPELIAEVEADAGLAAELRPYQKLGIRWLWTLRAMGLGGCLADDMGLGKTIQVLGVLSLAKRNKEPGVDLLVVPASLLDNWRLEIDRFAPQLKAFVAHPSRTPAAELKRPPASALGRCDVVITTYGTALRLDWIRDRDWRAVILDEAQSIKNPDTKQTRAVKSLKARWRLALTGTPIENKLGDLWSVFDFLNPGLLGSARQFTLFTKSLGNREHNAFAPLRKLLRPYILRRLKTDKAVIADLPDKTEVNAYCLLTKRQAAMYQKAVEEAAKAIRDADGMARRGLVLSLLMRLKQICNHPSHWLGDGEFAPAESGKFMRLREIGEEIAARQDKALVFTQFREMTGPLAAYLTDLFGRPGLTLHGGTPVKQRQELVRRFQENESVPFMVLSLRAGGSGLNLTAASHVIHFDRWWNPAVENQATDRAFRIGQKKNVLVHKFVCRGTLEERIDELILGKRRLSEEILSGGAESALTELSDEDLLRMVALDLSSSLD